MPAQQSGTRASLRIRSESNQWRSLAHGPEQYEVVAQSEGGSILLLGLGPDPAEAALAAAVAEGTAPVGPIGHVGYIEAPAFRDQMPEAWGKAIPSTWQDMTPMVLEALAGGDSFREFAAKARLVLYRPSLRLFPAFWGPILGRARLANGGVVPRSDSQGQGQGRATTPGVLLPSGDNDLLDAELRHAFAGAGWTVYGLPPGEWPDERAAYLEAVREVARHRPALFCSVNFQGLGPYGERFYCLREAGFTVAAWCVDNPWHLISGMKAAYWREIPLFVTDASFVAPLRAHGAKAVHHLPLAAWPELFAGGAAQRGGFEDLANRMAFVGRSAFPGKTGFFAGQKLDPVLWREAQAMIAEGKGRPDFAWWARRMEISELWPGMAARGAGFGAEESGLFQRRSCLAEAAEHLRVTVFGDAGWRDLVPDLADLRPPVDYYGSLPAIYASASITLNATSLLLPSGLTQRHFDVWAAGGFLLTDATPGLRLFPDELTKPVTFAAPADLTAMALELRSAQQRKRELTQAWRELILGEHTYAHRLRAMLSALGLAADEA